MATKYHHSNKGTHLRIRIWFGDRAMIGPGKIELLENIERTGSIAAACRAMDMSYKRAWNLIEEMNAAFAQPVVNSERGGARGGGATLTETGRALIAHFRAIEARASSGSEAEIKSLEALLKPTIS